MIKDANAPEAQVQRWPAECRFLFEERAGILEFEAGFSREEAEQKAEQMIREKMKKDLEARYDTTRKTTALRGALR